MSTFRYRSTGPEVLKNVSLLIRPGETIGIVGPSGSGKSTLTKLVQRLYAPTEGQVYLDGADLSQVDPAWLRSHIGVVLQENLLFNRTIHENIAFANPAMPRAQSDRDRPPRRRRRVHRQAPRRLRHHDRGARRQPVRRPAAADRHRPRAGDQSAHSHPRRGDVGARLRERADHPAQHAAHRQGPHGDHHRPSAGGGARLRPDRRHGRRTHRRDRLARGADPPSGRALRLSLGAAEQPRRDWRPAHDRCRSTPQPRAVAADAAIIGSSGVFVRRLCVREPRAVALPDAFSGRLSDREFLAPALEILETPASPVRLAFLWIICALVVVGLAVGLFRPHRHHRLGAGQVPADRPGQGDRAARDRAGRGHSGDQRQRGRQGRRSGRARPLGRRGGPRGGERRARLRPAPRRCGGRRRSPPRRRAPFPAAGDRLAGRHRAGVARARGSGAGGRPRPARRDARLVRRAARAEDRRARDASADDRDPEESRRDAAGARRHAHASSSSRSPARRPPSSTRPRPCNISRPSSRCQQAAARLAVGRARRDRPRLRESRGDLPVG